MGCDLRRAAACSAGSLADASGGWRARQSLRHPDGRSARRRSRHFCFAAFLFLHRRRRCDAAGFRFRKTREHISIEPETSGWGTGWDADGLCWSANRFDSETADVAAAGSLASDLIGSWRSFFDSCSRSSAALPSSSRCLARVCRPTVSSSQSPN